MTSDGLKLHVVNAAALTNIKPRRQSQRERYAETMSEYPPYQGEMLHGEKVLWRGRLWVVTSGGIDTNRGTYWIEKSRLMVRAPHWDNLIEFPIHLAEKEWVDLEELRAAYCVAVLLLRPKGTPKSLKQTADLIEASFAYARGEREGLQEMFGGRPK